VRWIPCLVLGACSAPNWSARLDVPAQPVSGRVIVVGAGVSGLTAAQVLHRSGIEVLVLEARDRIGGRTHTATLDGDPVDLGAAWVHGPRGNPVMDYLHAKRVDTVVSKSTGGTAVGTHDDSPFGAGELAQAESDLSRAQAEMSWVVEDDDLSMAEALDLALAQNSLNTARKDRARFLARQSVELDWAAPLDDISTVTTAFYETFPGPDVVPQGGYASMVGPLAQGLDVHLNHPVTRIEHGDDGVQVFVGEDVFEGAAVLVTVPLGVLQAGTIAFSPALAPAKQTALDHLAMGGLEKLMLTFDEAFWTKNTLLYMPEVEGAYTYCSDYSRHMSRPSLACFTGGAFSFGPRTQHTDDEVVATTLAHMARALGRDTVPEPRAFAVTRWADDPFAQGSYSYPRVGATLDDFEALAAPQGASLFFAGEHTEALFYQSVHGAFLSGLREAHRLGGDVTLLDGMTDALP